MSTNLGFALGGAAKGLVQGGRLGLQIQQIKQQKVRDAQQADLKAITDNIKNLTSQLSLIPKDNLAARNDLTNQINFLRGESEEQFTSRQAGFELSLEKQAIDAVVEAEKLAITNQKALVTNMKSANPDDPRLPALQEELFRMQGLDIPRTRGREAPPFPINQPVGSFLEPTTGATTEASSQFSKNAARDIERRRTIGRDLEVGEFPATASEQGRALTQFTAGVKERQKAAREEAKPPKPDIAKGKKRVQIINTLDKRIADIEGDMLIGRIGADKGGKKIAALEVQIANQERALEKSNIPNTSNRALIRSAEPAPIVIPPEQPVIISTLPELNSLQSGTLFVDPFTKDIKRKP